MVVRAVAPLGIVTVTAAGVPLDGGVGTVGAVGVGDELFPPHAVMRPTHADITAHRTHPIHNPLVEDWLADPIGSALRLAEHWRTR